MKHKENTESTESIIDVGINAVRRLTPSERLTQFAIEQQNDLNFFNPKTTIATKADLPIDTFDNFIDALNALKTKDE